SNDGRRMATVSTGGLVQVWNAGEGGELIQPFRHIGEVSRLAFSPDGQRLLVASTDGTARVWRLDPGRTGPRPFNFRHANTDRVLPLARPKGQRAVYCADGRREARYGGTQPGQIFERPPPGARAAPCPPGVPVSRLPP